MPKKRLIFTLLFDSESENYCLSRNFTLQKVGNISWLKKNYNFSNVSKYIDELIILEVSRNNPSKKNFCSMLKKLSSECFIPISAGGNIRNLNDARMLFLSGADKVVLNSPIFDNPELTFKIAREFGKQCLIGSFDLKKFENDYVFYTEKGSKTQNYSPKDFFNNLDELYLGEIYLNSINKDGTGQGYDFNLLDLIPEGFNLPLILSGGAGHSEHIIEALKSPKVDAASTAHLFNFMGNTLKSSREKAIDQKIKLALWHSD